MLNKIGFTEIIYNLDNLVMFYLGEAFHEVDDHCYLSAYSWIDRAEAVVSSANVLGCLYSEEYENIMDCLLAERINISVLDRAEDKKLGVF